MNSFCPLNHKGKILLIDQFNCQPNKSKANSKGMEILPVFANNGVASGLEKYKELKTDESYALNEGEMNQAGYNLLQNGKIKEAIEVFKINVAEFPDSWNTYDSLGEAFMIDGQKNRAIENYERSIKMNPYNSNGKEMLAKVRAQ